MDKQHVGLVPPETRDLSYTFKFLNEDFSIIHIMKNVAPPSVLQKHVDRISSSHLWYTMWFYLCNPNSTFNELYNSCLSALEEWGEPRGFKIAPNLIELETEAAEIRKRKRIYQAKEDAKKYGVDPKYLIRREYPDGKDRSNPAVDPNKFYFSYLMTTIESMNIDTSTKIGSSRRPVCKVIYKQNEWLNSEGNRSTDPTSYKLELFVGPFVSEEDSREFNKKWKVHRGAQPRRTFAKNYAKSRNMLCVDMRSMQPKKYIDDLRKQKKAKKEITF